MITVDQLRTHFGLYVREIDGCLDAECYWALLHVLLALPDVCACLEADPTETPETVGDRYTRWCDAYLPSSSTVSGDDRYQMRNALLHAGSTAAQNRGKHRTLYSCFSFVDPDGFGADVHGTTNSDRTVLNLHARAMADETKAALGRWFNALQRDPTKMSHVSENIARLARLQQKRVHLTGSDGVIVAFGLTLSST